MLDKDFADEKFVVALADLKARDGLKKGRTEPLTPQQDKNDGKKSKK